MKTILVPVDFSTTSINAARYAVRMSHQLKADKVVLFHTYGGSYQILDQGAEVVLATTQILLENMKQELHDLKEELNKIATADVTILTEVTDGFLLEDTLDLVKKHEADLIVMGITGKNTLEQKLMGTNTYRVASESPVPVLIVPSKANFQEVKHIALALKFSNELLKETPYQAINQMLWDLDASLTVLNVAKDDYKSQAAEVQEGVRAAHLMFDENRSKIVYLGQDEVVKSVTEYVNNNDIQMLISITHKMGFLQSLFKGSVTKSLAFYTHLPLLVFRAND
jgi:nucleotide-binding universal stress UspA family protein